MIIKIRILAEEHRLFRRRDFPWLTKYVNSMSFLQAKKHIEPELKQFITNNQNELQTIDKDITHQDWFDNLLTIIKEDFFQKGLARERLVISKIQQKHPNVKITNKVSYEEEYAGFDIKVSKNGKLYYFSVRGAVYMQGDKLTEYKEKLLKASKKFDAPVTLVLVKQDMKTLQTIKIKETNNG